MANPFIDDSFRIRWSQLIADAIEPDITQALEQAQTAIDALSVPLLAGECLSFDNTLLALEQATEELDLAWRRVGHLDAVRNNPDQREAYNRMLPRVSEFYAGLPLNRGLWRRIEAYARSDDAARLSGAKKRLLGETLADFRQNGADLPVEKQQRLEVVQAELARLTQKYAENVLDSTNAWDLIITDEHRLAGLPPTSRAILRGEAEASGLGSDEKPVWRVTLKAPSFIPVLEHAEDASLRQDVWRGSVSIAGSGDYDNTALIWQILELRHEKATLLGKEHFADHVLERRMAKAGTQAMQFVEDLHDRTKQAFERECTELEQFRAQQTGEPTEAFEPWDLAYWAEKQRKAKYDFDDEDLRPYFPIDGVLDGLFRIAEKIFQLRIQPRECVYKEPGSDAPDGIEVWHPDVKFYDLFDADSGEHRGSFYADWHPRDDKRAGAWMSYLRTGMPPDAPGAPRKPHLGLICGNLTPSSDGKPALLTHREVQTVFHEFGHLLHHLLGDVAIKSLNGVNVVWDFVELPSQIMENFCWERTSLDFFARHFETGEPIPQDLFEKMLAAQNYRSATAMMRQLSLAKLDLELHMHFASCRGRDLDALAEDLLADYQVPLKTIPPTIARRFGHLFSSATGYAAGYYSYKWAEVLDADAFTRFKDVGVLSSEVGREFREKILSKGNSEDAARLFRDFMGRDPSLTALLVRSGLAVS